MSVPSASPSPSSSLLSRLRRAAHFAYGLAALIGTLALWGWAIGLPRLRDLGPPFARRAPPGPFASVRLAVTFYSWSRSDFRSRRASYSAAAAAAGIALLA